MLKENSMNILGNKLFRVFFLVFLLCGIFLFKIPNSKAVGDASFPQDTTLQITVGGTLTNYTISGPSDADSLIVNPSSFVITISPGQSFTVTSSDRHVFINDSSLQTTCSGSSSRVAIGAYIQRPVTITPDGTTTLTAPPIVNSSNSGATGGGYAGAVAPTPSPVFSSTPLPTTPTPIVTSPAPTSIPAPSPTPSLITSQRVIFNRDLHFGMSGDDVKALQDYLRASGYYYNPNSTGFFDTPTKKAVIAWQKKNKLLSSGYFGPYSRAKYNQTSLTQEVVQKKTPDTLELKPGIKLLNVRLSPSTRAKIVSKLKAGQQINFVDAQNGWYKVQNSDGSFGWVSGQYVIIK